MSPELDSIDFEVSFGYSAESGDQYILCATAKNGMLSLQLSVAADLIAPVVLANSNVVVAMSPDGLLRVYADRGPPNTSIGAENKLDVLIKQSINSQMLEDEPDAAAMLQTLRSQLTSSLATVDEAIANIAPKQKP